MRVDDVAGNFWQPPTRCNELLKKRGCECVLMIDDVAGNIWQPPTRCRPRAGVALE